MKKHSWMFSRKALNAVLGICAVIALIVYGPTLWSLLGFYGSPQAIATSLREFGVLGPALLFVLLLVQLFIGFIPGHALVMASGYVYGAPVTILVVSVSTILGSQVAFLLARRYGRPIIYRLASPATIQSWDKLAAGRGPWFYFFSFVLPFFPSDMMCYVAGLSKVSARGFFVANVCGRLLATIAMTLLGSYGLQPPVWFWVALAGALLILAIAWTLYSRPSRVLTTAVPILLSVRRTALAIRTRVAGLSSTHARRRELATEISYAILRQLLHIYLRIFSLRCSVEGTWPLPAGAKIIAANHANATDPFYLPFILPERLHFLMQNGLFRIAGLGWLFHKAEQVSVDRQRGSGSYREACEWLRRGETIVIYPEAHLNPDGEPLPCKTGAVRMSLETGAPIIPLGVYVDPANLVELGPPKGLGDRPGRWQFSGLCVLRFGTPWWPGKCVNVDPNPVRALTDRMRGMVYALVAEAQDRAEAHASPAPQPTPVSA